MWRICELNTDVGTFFFSETRGHMELSILMQSWKCRRDDGNVIFNCCAALLWEETTEEDIKTWQRSCEASGRKRRKWPDTGEKSFQPPNRNFCCRCAQSIPSKQSHWAQQWWNRLTTQIQETHGDTGRERREVIVGGTWGNSCLGNERNGKVISVCSALFL